MPVTEIIVSHLRGAVQVRFRSIRLYDSNRIQVSQGADCTTIVKFAPSKKMYGALFCFKARYVKCQLMGVGEKFLNLGPQDCPTGQPNLDCRDATIPDNKPPSIVRRSRRDRSIQHSALSCNERFGGCSNKRNGAQGRDRTTDTAIFSRMLYQLSYLGILGRPKGLGERAVYREVGRSCPPSFACGFGVASPPRAPSPNIWRITPIRRLRGRCRGRG